MVSATTFVGSIQGNVAGNLSTTGTVTAGTVNATTKFVGTLTGDVVGGTLYSNNISVTTQDPYTKGYITGAWKLTSQSTLQATYSDLAERYHADAAYEVGTVLVVGGDAEVTVTTDRAHTSVAGIVSTNPAYMMNSDAGSDDTHPYIALKGRVPCKVVGPVRKGERLVTSIHAGYACSAQDIDSANATIGIALESFEGDFGVIEVKV